MIDLRRLCLDLHINSRPVKKFEGEKTYISTGDSDDMENADTVTFHNRPSRANVAPIKNDVIFAKMANTDKTFLIDEDLATNIYSTGFFDVSSTRILPKFLYYLIQSDEFDSYKNAYSEGTTQISISDKRLKKIKITYETDKNKQQKIADYLDKKVGIIDKLIANINQQIECLEKLKKARIDECFISNSNKEINNYFFEKIPSDFSYMKLNFLIAGMKDGTHGSFNRQADGEMLLSAKNVFNGEIIYGEEESYISAKDYRSIIECGYPRKGDVLLTIVGTIGRTVVYDFDKPLAFQRSVLFVRPRSIVSSHYLKYFFMSDFFVMQYQTYIKQSAQAGLYGGDFKKCYVFYPDKEKQTKIVEYIDKQCEKIDNLLRLKTKKISGLKQYKKSLIYECVTGKKEVL